MEEKNAESENGSAYFIKGEYYECKNCTSN